MESGFKFRSPGSKIQLWTATPLPLVEYTSNLCFHSHVDIHPVLLSHGPFGGNKLTSQWTRHMVSLQRSQDWLAFFLFFMMCEPAGLTITSGPSISCSLPGLLLLGIPSRLQDLAQTSVSSESLSQLHTLTLCFPNTLNKYLTEASIAQHCHAWRMSLSSPWDACSMRMGPVSYLTQWSSQHALLALAAHSKCSGNVVAWSNENFFLQGP